MLARGGQQETAGPQGGTAGLANGASPRRHARLGVFGRAQGHALRTQDFPSATVAGKAEPCCPHQPVYRLIIDAQALFRG